jgi:hypothetical protein
VEIICRGAALKKCPICLFLPKTKKKPKNFFKISLLVSDLLDTLNRKSKKFLMFFLAKWQIEAPYEALFLVFQQTD